MHLAASKGFLTFAKLLNKRNVPYDMEDKDGKTPTYYAQERGFYHITHFLYLCQV